jgi:hypothetical protein
VREWEARKPGSGYRVAGFALRVAKFGAWGIAQRAWRMADRIKEKGQRIMGVTRIESIFTGGISTSPLLNFSSS